MTTRIPCLCLSIALLATSLATAQVSPDDLAAAKRQEHQAMGLSLNADDAPMIVLGPGDTELSGTLDSSSESYDRIFTSTFDAQCGATSTDSTVGNAVYYQQFHVEFTGPNIGDALVVTVDAAGTTLDDTVLSLYCDPFDPQNPTANLVAFNDDTSGSRLSQLDLTGLTIGQEYRLVISTFAPGDVGTFRITLGGGEDVPVEVQSFSVD